MEAILIINILKALTEARRALSDLIAHAISAVYAESFGGILSGDLVQIIMGIFVILGISLMVVRGLWKTLAPKGWM